MAAEYTAMKFADRVLKGLSDAPLLRLLDWLRKNFYTRPWPDHRPGTHIPLPADRYEELLRENNFEGVPLSYDYEEAVLDLRRPEGVTDGLQFEIHVRAREHPEKPGLEVHAHAEPSRYEHKEKHIKGVGTHSLTEEQIQDLTPSVR